MGFPPPGGHPELRRVLTDHLHRSRGVVLDADDIVVSTGVTDGAARLFRALRAEGITRVAVEDPGWTRLHHVAREAGLTVVPVPVDEQGLRVAERPAGVGTTCGAVVDDREVHGHDRSPFCAGLISTTRQPREM
ncbi:aminotransferase class I/II-fold pyridoxal phosphate-dependent enzyme [Streptomyces sp. NPDC019990]|uniref:aminotransferase class I/II-fold pyridoxal phosphate-dependent enzyme n=1 Tax=Streptomyces sp. NPDC019990 TaxID=3154693 RepID=UPI003402DBEB